MDLGPLDEPVDTEKPMSVKEDGTSGNESPKPRRGRPPGSKNRTTSVPRGHAADVSAALAVMQGAYDFILLGLQMTSPRAAGEWGLRIDQLQASNRTFFQSSPPLAARIAKIGTTGGTAAFLISNAVAIAPIIQMALPDIRMMFDPSPANDGSQSSV